MKRLLFNTLCGFSLVLCLAILSFWARSYWVYDSMTRSAADSESNRVKQTEVTISSSDGDVIMSYFMAFYKTQGTPVFPPMGFRYDSREAGDLLPMPSDTLARRWGFGYDTRTSHDGGPSKNWASQSTGSWIIWMPHWIFALATATLPVVWLISRAKVRKQRRRFHLGLCRQCGYDLRATPKQCPECGAIAGPAETTSN